MTKTTMLFIFFLCLFLIGCGSGIITEYKPVSAEDNKIEVCQGNYVLKREYAWGMCNRGCLMVNESLVEYETMKFVMNTCKEMNKTILVKLW